MNYKDLNKYEKLAKVQDIHFCKVERANASKYLYALWKEDITTIAHYESFGDTPYKFLMNKRSYDQQQLFGFTTRKFDEHGWLERPQFLDIEKFDFPHRDGWAVWNDIEIGRGVNGKWAYGISYSSGTGGYGSGISVWGKVFDSRKECLTHALKEMMEGHREGKGDKYSIRVLKQVKELLDEVMGRKVVQLSLF